MWFRVALVLALLSGTASADRWIPGDLHQHVSPPTDPAVTLGVADVAQLARDHGLEFVILTPHLWPAAWNGPQHDRFVTEWHAMADAARAVKDVTLIPGVEFGVPGVGHFGVSGVDLEALTGEKDFLAAARAHGALIVLNHPFAVPTHIPGVSASDWDMSYKPWTQGTPGFGDVDAVEVWNVPLGLANLVSRPGGQSAEERAFAAADARARKERRVIAVVGGSDNHKTRLTPPTTWVLAPDASAAAILAGVRAGKTCVGGPEAGTLEVRGDADAAWVGVGGHARAAHRLELRFTGEARVFVDGVDRGKHTGTYATEVDGAPHTVRIVVGQSRSGFVYANM
jgi:hypothetical protein